MSQKEILKLALEAAIEHWGECRYLAGLDGSISCQNYAATAKPSRMREYAAAMEAWSQQCDLLEEMIREDERAERQERRREREEQKAEEAGLLVRISAA